MRVSGKTTVGSPRISERELKLEKKKRPRNWGIEEGEISDVVGEEVMMEGIDYAKVKNKVNKSKKRVSGTYKIKDGIWNIFIP